MAIYRLASQQKALDSWHTVRCVLPSLEGVVIRLQSAGTLQHDQLQESFRFQTSWNDGPAGPFWGNVKSSLIFTMRKTFHTIV